MICSLVNALALTRAAYSQDECLTATVISEGSQPFSTTTATASPEPVNGDACSPFSLNWTTVTKDVWFRYSPAQAGLLELHTCKVGSFNTSLVVYAGTCGSLTQIACSADANGLAGCQTGYSRIANLSVEPDQTYFIRVGGYGSNSGSGELTVVLKAAPVACGDGQSCTQVHIGPGCNELGCCALVCQVDPWCCDASWDASCVANAVTVCDAFIPGCVGANPAVANDCLLNAATVTSDASIPFTLAGCNTDGPRHPASVCSSGNDLLLNDIWFLVPAAGDGVIRADTCGSVNFDSKLAIYDLGTDPSSFDYSWFPAALVGCNDDGSAPCQLGATYASELTVHAVRGHSYLVRVATYDLPGSGTLHLDVPEPCSPQASALAESEVCGSESNSGCGMATGIDVLNAGSSIEGRSWHQGAAADVDRYILDITEASEVSVLVQSVRPIDARIEIGDPATCTFAAVASASETCSAALERCLSPGRYYVAVSARTAGPEYDCSDPETSRYSVSVSTQPASCPQTVQIGCLQSAPDAFSVNYDAIDVSRTVSSSCIVQSAPTCSLGGTYPQQYARSHPPGSLGGSIRCIKFGVKALRRVRTSPENSFCIVTASESALPASVHVCRDIDGGAPRRRIVTPGDGGDLEVIATREVMLPGGSYAASLDFSPALCIANETKPIVVILDTPDFYTGTGAAAPYARSGYQIQVAGNGAGPGYSTYFAGQCVSGDLRPVDINSQSTQWVVEVLGDFEGCPCDNDSDDDGTPDCVDGCPNDSEKIAPGACGCGLPDADTDLDGTPDCTDGCPNDATKTSPGSCGCGSVDADSDGDGTLDCADGCPNDASKTSPGICGCGAIDTAVDSDGDGSPDCTDNCPALANPSQADCDQSGVGDACELASGLLGDCDADGVPDNCEGASRTRLRSPWLSPFGSGAPATYSFGQLGVAAGVAPRLTIEASSDLGSSNEFIALSIDQAPPVYIFVQDGSDCPQVPDVWSRGFTLAEFNALTADGLLRVDLVASGTVSAAQCAQGGVRITLEYDSYSPVADCNANGALDSCELATGSAQDLNLNGIVDSCDIASGFEADCNSNGTIDSTEIRNGSAADCDRDGVLDACAIAAGAPDCNADGVPDACEGSVSFVARGGDGYTAFVGSGPITRFSVGTTHVAAIHAAGRPSIWGYDGWETTRLPQGLDQPIAVAAGSFHTAFLDGSGRVRCSGANASGQCDVPLDLPPAVAIAASRREYYSEGLASLEGHTMALLADGSVRCWGASSFGQCSVPFGVESATAIAAGGHHSGAIIAGGSLVLWGRNTNGQSRTPAGLGSISKLALGHSHSVALRPDGTVACWGSNTSGQCDTPAGLTTAIGIAAGSRHTMALRADGTVVAWGGAGMNMGQATVPATLNGVVAIDAAEFQSAALRSDGTLVRWGSDYMGLPTPPSAARPIRKLVLGQFGQSVGYGHSAALLDDGTVACWGMNRAGQCNVPAGLDDAIDVAVASIMATNGGHTVALRRNGAVVCWGNNTSGQCNVPTDLGPARAIAAAGSTQGYTLALGINGKVRAWGANQSGQRDVPATLDGVRAIAAGPNFCLALRASGTVVHWGGAASFNITPPSTLGDARAVAAGTSHALALRANGSVVEWGYGAAVPPADLTDAVAIAAGSSLSLALKRNGEVVRWGAASSANTTAEGPYGSISCSGFNQAFLRCSEVDCNSNGLLDTCEIATGAATDCDGDGLIDACEIREAASRDCNSNGVLDTCEFAAGTATDCDSNGLIDSCQLVLVADSDCDDNGLVDSCEIATGSAVDCNSNGRIDACEIAAEPNADCDSNGLLDACELGAGARADCNANGRLDDCDAQGPAIAAWGSNSSGVLVVPERLPTIIALDAGADHALALDAQGRVLAWGSNASGACSVPDGLGLVVAVAAGGIHSVALRADGSLRCWGSNESGQCSVPQDLEPIVQVAAGGGFTLTRSRSGTVRGFGSDVFGQCSVPIDLGAALSIGAGTAHALAVDATGAVRAWGFNAHGQCDVPNGLRSVAQVDAGTWHSVALTADGRVACWGAGSASGGSVNQGQSLVPPGLGPCVAIAAGRRETVALRADGVVVRWGPAGSAYVVPAGIGAMERISAGGDFVLAGRTATPDCNGDGVPDACQPEGSASDCNANGVPDWCDVAAGASDCNGNGRLDSCEIAEGSAGDCDGDSTLDSCEIAAGAPDCNANGEPDACDLGSGASTDLNASGIPDECEGIVGGSGYPTIQAAIDARPDGSTILVAPGIWSAFTLSARSVSIRSIAGPGATFIDGGGTSTCVSIVDAGPSPSEIDGFTIRNGRGIDGGGLRIVQASPVIRNCRIIENAAFSRGGGAFCEASNARFSQCVFERDSAPTGAGLYSLEGTAEQPILSGSRFCLNDSTNITGPYVDGGGNILGTDCDGNGLCDIDQIASGEAADCNLNGLPDDCELDSGAPDCNANGVLDSCDIASGQSSDVDANGVPDECKSDCNGNGVPDNFEIGQDPTRDCDSDATLDSCEISANPALDCDADGSLDSCELAADPTIDCDENGRIDSCDLDAGKEDKNQNGRPDSCDLAAGDLNLDGTVGAADLTVLLSFWGFPTPPVGDLDGNGTVGASDLTILLGNWGVLGP